MKSIFVSENEEFLFDTVSQIKIKKDHPQQQNFLEYPTSKSLENRLFADPKQLTLNFITTWSCNLRCPFCFVLKRLKREFKPNKFNMAKVSDFVEAHSRKYPDTKKIALIIGGEPLLAPDECGEIVKLANSFGMSKSITTNLSVKLGKAEVDILKEMNDIQVSIDGPKEMHNSARKVLRSKENPTDANADVYSEAIKNLGIAVASGVDPQKINVSSSVSSEHLDKKYASDWEGFFYELYVLGIENIKVGSIAGSSYYATSETPKFDGFRIAQSPCCCFRYMNYFVIEDENTLKTNYFSNSPAYNLGSIDAPIEQIANNYKSMMLGSMPALQDDKCLSCEALGFCWGQCFGSGQYEGKTPGDLCDQDAIIAKKNELLASNKFLNKYLEIH